MKDRENGPARAGRLIHLRPRYYRLFTDPPMEEAEENYRHAELDWHMPLGEAALVSLDVWNYHFSRDTLERIEDITVHRIAPLVEACRCNGLQIIHAPAAPVAQKHPNWTRLVEQATPHVAPNSDWPPEDFRNKTGRFARYARPHEPQKQERDEHRRTRRDFHPAVRPECEEAVILDGQELHLLCKQRGILNLFYVGFNTNACMVMRPYGTYAMMGREYNVILVRDCTTGMETHEGKAELVCTRGAIASLEQFGAYTVTSHQLIAALSASPRKER